jgi:hypothetical protein
VHKAYYSGVLPQSAGAVWSMIRDFNNDPRYRPATRSSAISGTRAARLS